MDNINNTDTLKQAAITLCGYGLGVVLCGTDKRPVVNWDACKQSALTVEEIEVLFSGGTIRPDYVTKRGDKGVRVFKPCTSIGVVGGDVSGGLEVVDVDSKYDKTGTLYADLMRDVERMLPEVYPHLVVVKTQSGGYHIPYRAPNIEGNKKLALRLVTPDEREEYYTELITKGSTPEAARIDADAHTELTLLETRGNGGYVLVPPSPNYTLLHGNYGALPTLTASERDTLINIARSYNQVHKVVSQPKVAPSVFNAPAGTVSPFDDYNRRGDVLEVLNEYGWRIVYTAGDRVILRRPGKTTSDTSGNYHTGKRLFTAWSTNAPPFEAERAYPPASVFTLLDCNGDTKEAYRKLLALGYGTAPGGGNGGGVPLSAVQVDAVHRQDKTTRVIAEPGGVLKPAEIHTTHTAEDVIITSPGRHAESEVVSVIDALMSKHPRVYVAEDGVEDAACIYKLNNILRRYDAIQESNGGVLSDRDVHAFLDEVVGVSKLLEPMHADMYRQGFLTHPGVTALGITPEAYNATDERLRYRVALDRQTAATRGLMSRVEDMISKGNTSAAVQEIIKQAPALAMHTRVDDFRKRMEPLKREDIVEWFKNTPESIPSGFYVNSEEVLIPAGGVTYYAGATGHGKTSMLINTMLHMADLPQCEGKTFHYLTYEMDKRSIYAAILNTYLADDVARNNYDAIVKYYKHGSVEDIHQDKREYFTARAERFMDEMILSGRIRIHHVDDDSGTLAEFIAHLHQEYGNIAAVFIDYVQLISPGGDDTNSARHEQVKNVAKDLMSVAINTGLPIIAASQFNRTVMSHDDLHRNNASEGSYIEKSAALMVGVWNNTKEPTAEDKRKKALQTSGAWIPGTLYIKILKARYQEDDVWGLHGWNGNTRKIKMHKPAPPTEQKKNTDRWDLVYE